MQRRDDNRKKVVDDILEKLYRHKWKERIVVKWHIDKEKHEKEPKL
jgi:hypothetical protein